MPRVCKANLLEDARLLPRGKNSASGIGGQIHVAAGAIIIADEEAEILLGFDLQKSHIFCDTLDLQPSRVGFSG